MARNAAASIYGTVLVTAIVAGSANDDALSPWEGMIILAATAIVFWVAHVYANLVALRLERGRRATKRERAAVRLHELPMLEGCVLPLIALLFGGLGVIGRAAAFNLAIGLGVITLFGWGIAYGRREGRGLWGSLLSGLINSTLGLMVVLLKVFVD